MHYYKNMNDNIQHRKTSLITVNNNYGVQNSQFISYPYVTAVFVR